MNRFMRNFLIVIFVLFFNPIVAISSDTGQETSFDSSQKTASQQEQERMKAALKRLQQPEVKLERQMLDDMNSAMEKYYQSKDETSRQKYESLYEQALALPKPSAKVYSACATAANLLGRHREAIAILKKAIAEYPDERVWGPKIPLKISGYYRIGSIALQIGDANEAMIAYETVIINSQDIESAKFTKLGSLMLLADITTRLIDNKPLAIKRLRETKEIIETIDVDSLQHEENNTLKFLKGWVLFELERLETGAAPTRKKSDLGKVDFGSPFLLAMTHLTMSYCSMPEIEQAAENDNSSFDSILTWFGLAYNCMHYEQTQEAEKYLLSIAKTDSYFKSYAEVMLDAVHEQADRISKRIPTFINNFKNGNMQQREASAQNLARDPEGIKVLYEAQQDPNKYVRYIAAFNIAQWGRDPSIKPDFNIILEALTDKDPQIRRKANSALVFSSSLEIGPKEIVAIIQLMNKNYSPELMHWLNLILVSAPKDQNILEAAVPELAKLFTNPDKSISIGTHNILRRMKVSKAGAVPVLLQSLNKEEGEMQRRIIELLGNLGADAEQAIPVIITYIDHEDINLQSAAETALKKISPDKAEELIEKK